VSSVKSPEPFHFDESWLYNLAHFHVDPEEAATQPELVAALFQMFEQAVEQTAQWSRPSNVWLLFIPDSPEESAAYVHAENPYGTPFPYDFEGVSWEVPAHPLLAPLVRPEHQVGMSNYTGEMYWVRMRPSHRDIPRNIARR
jgi:hypothetical protein